MIAALATVFLALPVVALVGRAIVDGSLGRSVGSRVVVDALVLSLTTTAVSLCLTVAFGLPLAWLLARRTFRGKGWLEAVIDLPIVLPPSVAGLALLIVLRHQRTVVHLLPCLTFRRLATPERFGNQRASWLIN